MSKEIIHQVYNAWNSAADMRARRDRCKRYTYGDQWSDLVRDSRGRLRRESEIVAESGKSPLINNLIRQLVKTVVGRYRTIAAEEGFYSLAPIKALAGANALPELDSRLLEEFLISGCAIQRICEEERFGHQGVWIDNVDFRRFIVNAFSDPRGWDINMVGMLHDMSFPELAARFSRGSAKRAAALRELYRPDASSAFIPDTVGLPGADIDFFRSRTPGMCRVIELWTLDAGSITEGDSLHYRFKWHCRWLAPDGTVLSEYNSPFAHGSHPFAVKFYPLTDGEVHSFVEDVIDQQRSINRMVVLIDKIMATSAKGVLLFPQKQLVKDFSWQDVCNRWAQSDGVIPISGNGEYLPQQVVTNAGNSGAYQLLELQLRLFEETAGVGDALSGRGSSGVRGAELFDAQVKNATIALADIFDTFSAFTAQRNEKAAIISTKSE